MPEINIAVRVQSGDLSQLQKLTNILHQAAAAETILKSSAVNKNQAMSMQNKIVQSHNKSVKEVTKSTDDFTSSIGHNILKVFQWSVATMAVFNALRLLKTAATDVIDVEYAMAGLTKVMRNGQQVAKDMRMPLLELGVLYGELGTEVINASTEWARLGLTQKQIADNAKVSLMATSVAEMEVTDATKFLISAQQQFHRSINDNMAILDSWNQLSNTYAVRTIDLAQATQRAGSAIYATGGNMQDLNGYTTALVQATGRSGNEIGNAIKTFVQYSTRVETVNQLMRDNVIQVQDVGNNLLNFNQIIEGVALKWATLDEVTKRNTATSMAGTRQANVFINLMEQYPTVLKAQADAWRSSGSSMREAQILLGTTRKQLDSMRSAFMMMVSSLQGYGIPVFKLFIQSLTGLMLGFAKFPPLFYILVTALMALSVAFKRATASALGFGAALKAASVNPYVLGLTAVVALVTALATQYGNAARNKARLNELESYKKEEAFTDFMGKGVDLKIVRNNLNTYEALLKRKGSLDDKGRRRLEEAKKAIEKSYHVDMVRINTLKEGTGLMWWEDGKGVRHDIEPGKSGYMTRALLQDKHAIEQLRTGMISVDELSNEEQIQAGLARIQDIRNEIAKAEARHLTEAQARIKSNDEEIKSLQEKKDVYEDLYEILINKDMQGFMNKYGGEKDTLDAETKKMATTVFSSLVGGKGASASTLEKLKSERASIEAQITSLQSKQDELGKARETMLEPPLEGDLLNKYFDGLKQRLDEIAEKYRYLGAMAKAKGKDESESMALTLTGLKEQQSLLQDELSKENIAGTGGRLGEGYEKVNKELTDVQSNIRKLDNDIRVAKFSEKMEDYDKSIKKASASLELYHDKQLAYARAFGDEINIAETGIKKTKALIESTEKDITYRDSMGRNTEKQQESLDELNMTLEEQEYILENITRKRVNFARSMELIDFNAEIEQLNKQTVSLIDNKRGLDAVANATLNLQSAQQKLNLIRESGSPEEMEQARRNVEIASAQLNLSKIERNLSNQEENKARNTLRYSQGADTLNNLHNKRMAIYKHLGLSEDVMLSKNVDLAEQMYVWGKTMDMDNAVLVELKANIDNAKGALQEYKDEQRFEEGVRDFEQGFERGYRKFDMHASFGIPDNEVIKSRLDYVREQRGVLIQSTNITAKVAKIREMNEQIKSLQDDLTAYRINKEREVVDNILDQQRRMVETWQSDIVSVMTGDAKIFDAIGNVISRIQKKILMESVKGVATQLGEWEFLLTGESPEKLIAEEEKRLKEVQALMEGGNYIASQIRQAGVDAGNYMRANGAKVAASTSLDKTGDASMDSYLTGGGSLSDVLNGKSGWSKMDYANIGMSGLGILSQNVDNRGGGARVAGSVAGGIIGGIWGPAGAIIGMQAGQIIVGTIQGWWRSKKDEDKKATPSGESLRSALADTITRGSFRDAAQITYYVNNTYSLGFMIPDSAQMTRVVSILQKEGLKFDKNINARG